MSAHPETEAPASLPPLGDAACLCRVWDGLCPTCARWASMGRAIDRRRGKAWHRIARAEKARRQPFIDDEARLVRLRDDLGVTP